MSIPLVFTRVLIYTCYPRKRYTIILLDTAVDEKKTEKKGRHHLSAAGLPETRFQLKEI